MPDAVKLLQKKFILMKSVLLVFSVLFFLMIAPIPQLEVIRNIDPVLLWSGSLLLFVGLVLLIEFFRNLPDAGNHTGAKTGAYMFLVLGVIALLYGILTFTGTYNAFEFAGTTDIPNFGLTILLGIVSAILYASIHPEIFHHKTLAKHIKATV